MCCCRTLEDLQRDIENLKLSYSWWVDCVTIFIMISLQMNDGLGKAGQLLRGNCWSILNLEFKFDSVWHPRTKLVTSTAKHVESAIKRYCPRYITSKYWMHVFFVSHLSLPQQLLYGYIYSSIVFRWPIRDVGLVEWVLFCRGGFFCV